MALEISVAEAEGRVAKVHLTFGLQHVVKGPKKFAAHQTGGLVVLDL